MSGIQLRCKVFPLAFLLYFFKPRCSIDDGPEQVLMWGENMLPGPPGRHTLRVWYPYLTGPTNVANAVVDVPPQGLAVVYKTRWIVFLPGKLEAVDPSYAQYVQTGQTQYRPQQQPGPGWAPQQPTQQPMQQPVQQQQQKKEDEK